ncbi:MAG: hypothetical protein L0H36_02835 [bacterium]|nr:hypothetical protein [bacterium]
MTEFEILGFITFYTVVTVAVFGYGYFLIWNYANSELKDFGNMYDEVRSVKKRPLRIIAKVIAAITWPLWSFMQIELLLWRKCTAAVFKFCDRFVWPQSR